MVSELPSCTAGERTVHTFSHSLGTREPGKYFLVFGQCVGLRVEGRDLRLGRRVNLYASWEDTRGAPIERTTASEK